MKIQLAVVNEPLVAPSTNKPFYSMEVCMVFKTGRCVTNFATGMTRECFVRMSESVVFIPLFYIFKVSIAIFQGTAVMVFFTVLPLNSIPG